MPASHDAFISYSHKADGALARALEAGLEKLAKPLLQLRALEVFRDETALAASPELWGGIEAHLGRSRWLVLLACPASAQSHWCGRELQWWLERQGPQRVLVVLTEGEIAWDREAKDFDWTSTTALSTLWSGRLRDEPLYVDLRWARDSPALTLEHARFRAAVLDLAAPIRDQPKDQLDGEDVRQTRRNRLVMRGLQTGLATAGLVAAGFAVFAELQRREAVAQRTEAEHQRSEAELQRGQAENERDMAEVQRALAVDERQRADRERDEAVRQRQLAELRERIALSRQFTTASVQAFDQRLDHALVLAAKAVLAHPGVEAESQLRRTHEALPATVRAALPGHRGAATSLAFDRSGRWLVSGGMDGLVVLWDVQRRQPVRTLQAQVGVGVVSVSLHPDGTRVAAGGAANEVHAWDLRTGREVGEHARSRWPIGRVAYSADGQRLYWTDVRGDVEVLDAANMQALRSPAPGRLGRGGAIVSAGGVDVQAQSGSAGPVELWRWGAAGKHELAWPRETKEMHALALSDDGETLATAHERGSLFLWRTGQPGAKPAFVYHGSDPDLTAVALGRNGLPLATGAADGTVQFYRPEGHPPNRVGVPAPAHRGAVLALAFSPDGQTLASAGLDGAVLLWDVRRALARAPAVTVEAGAADAREAPAALRRAARWRVGGGDQPGLWVRGPDPATLEQRVPLPPLAPLQLTPSPDGRHAVVHDYTGVWCLVDQDSPSRPHLPPPGGEVLRGVVALAPGGRHLLARTDGGLALVETGTGRALRHLVAPGRPGNDVEEWAAFDATGGQVAVVSARGGVQLLRSADGTVLQQWRREAFSAPHHVALSDDGRQLAIGDGASLLLWKAPFKGGPWRRLVPPRLSITDMAFGPGGHRLYVSDRRRLEIWDVASGQRIGEVALAGTAWRVGDDDTRLYTIAGDKPGQPPFQVQRLDLAPLLERACALSVPSATAAGSEAAPPPLPACRDK